VVLQDHGDVSRNILHTQVTGKVQMKSPALRRIAANLAAAII
jgi:hypothetical protein